MSFSNSSSASSNRPVSKNMRLLHRYLGFFLAGIMAVYAISGIVLIFRDTKIFKKEKHVERTVKAGLNDIDLGKELKIRNLSFKKQEAGVAIFEQGTYNITSGAVAYTQSELPFILTKLTNLHKASTKKPLFFLNIFFGLSLLFFVISSFWMFRPKTTIFRKGIYFTIAGIVFTIIILFV